MTSALMQIQVNGGGPQTGGIQLASASGQTIHLAGINTTGWKSAIWEIYSYPVGFNPGGSWTLAADGYTWNQSTTGSPSDFVIGPWGRYMTRVRVNGNPLAQNSDGSPNQFFVSSLTDSSTALDVLSPAGRHDIAYGEQGQFSARGWPTAQEANLRIDEQGLAAPASVGTLALTTGTFTPAAAVYQNRVLTLTGTLSGNCTVVLPSLVGASWIIDATAVVLSGHTITLQANGNNWATTVGVTNVYDVTYGGTGKLYGVSRTP